MNTRTPEELAALPFEELLRHLDEAVERLDSDELTLEAALDTYQEAVLVASVCSELLEKAELRVRQIDELFLQGFSAEVGRELELDDEPF
jgi:exodeoxyribonuclease VII small subunit